MLNREIRELVTQASRWGVAAKQDENVMIKVLHANYGAGYLYALMHLASRTEIEAAMKEVKPDFNFKKFKSAILGVQDKATNAMSKLYPKFAPDGPKVLVELASARAGHLLF